MNRFAKMKKERIYTLFETLSSYFLYVQMGIIQSKIGGDKRKKSCKPDDLQDFGIFLSPFGVCSVGAEGSEPKPLAYYSSVTCNSKSFFVHDLAMILWLVLSFLDS